MKNDNSQADNWGHLPQASFWRSGRFEIIRHCEGVFDLLVEGVLAMPSNTFETITNYLYAEFDVL